MAVPLILILVGLFLLIAVVATILPAVMFLALRDIAGRRAAMPAR